MHSYITAVLTKRFVVIIRITITWVTWFKPEVRHKLFPFFTIQELLEI